jgi:hypothetical protein
MRSVNVRNQGREILRRRFGSETDVETITGFSRRTLQKDRLLGTVRFPHYKVGGKILYDLDEVERVIRASSSESRTP